MKIKIYMFYLDKVNEESRMTDRDLISFEGTGNIGSSSLKSELIAVESVGSMTFISC